MTLEALMRVRDGNMTTLDSIVINLPQRAKSFMFYSSIAVSGILILQRIFDPAGMAINDQDAHILVSATVSVVLTHYSYNHLKPGNEEKIKDYTLMKKTLARARLYSLCLVSSYALTSLAGYAFEYAQHIELIKHPQNLEIKETYQPITGFDFYVDAEQKVLEQSSVPMQDAAIAPELMIDTKKDIFADGFGNVAGSIFSIAGKVVDYMHGKAKSLYMKWALERST
jgi:hypothetical protein